MMNLLTDLVFRVRTPEGPATASLPELLALLGEDRVDSLPGLQRHQEDAFHIFLCYLAGAVLDHETNPVLDVTVVVDDATLGGSPDGTAALSVTVTWSGALASDHGD